MYCQNCGTKNTDTASFCVSCGQSLDHSSGASQFTAVQRNPQASVKKTEQGEAKHPATLRVIKTLYVLAYIIVILFSLLIWAAMVQTSKEPNAQSSYITCANGTKYSYSQLSIYNPATDFNSDASVINGACGNNGGNTYTNSTADSRSPIWYGFIAFGVGAAIIEAVKSGLVYMTQGYVPGLFDFGKKAN